VQDAFGNLHRYCSTRSTGGRQRCCPGGYRSGDRRRDSGLFIGGLPTPGVKIGYWRGRCRGRDANGEIWIRHRGVIG
jgi:hypothetical protein